MSSAISEARIEGRIPLGLKNIRTIGARVIAGIWNSVSYLGGYSAIT